MPKDSMNGNSSYTKLVQIACLVVCASRLLHNASGSKIAQRAGYEGPGLGIAESARLFTNEKRQIMAGKGFERTVIAGQGPDLFIRAIGVDRSGICGTMPATARQTAETLSHRAAGYESLQGKWFKIGARRQQLVIKLAQNFPRSKQYGESPAQSA